MASAEPRWTVNESRASPFIDCSDPPCPGPGWRRASRRYTECVGREGNQWMYKSIQCDGGSCLSVPAGGSASGCHGDGRRSAAAFIHVTACTLHSILTLGISCSVLSLVQTVSVEKSENGVTSPRSTRDPSRWVRTLI
ncbi:hypothetical protein J6590_032062 [Homalodisca vitripennis]|nr:hypothetical protein J6590_032062 [Homalodisca vitripennis]